MKLSEHKELKKEILSLPEKEKDKLLLRLIAKDKVLTEHLHFQLLEDEGDLKYRVEAIKEEIISSMNTLSKQKKLNAKDGLVVLRALMKEINHFVKVTKAPFEELELRFFLFNHSVADFKSRIFSSYKNYEYLFASYFVKQMLMALKKFDKLHEDLQFDLKESVNKSLEFVYSTFMKQTAIELNLPKAID